MNVEDFQDVWFVKLDAASELWSRTVSLLRVSDPDEIYAVEAIIEKDTISLLYEFDDELCSKYDEFEEKQQTLEEPVLVLVGLTDVKHYYLPQSLWEVILPGDEWSVINL